MSPATLDQRILAAPVGSSYRGAGVRSPYDGAAIAARRLARNPASTSRRKGFMGKGLSAPRMPPLLFPDASRDDPQKRSSRFSLYFHIDAFQFPIFPAPLRFPLLTIFIIHHISSINELRVTCNGTPSGPPPHQPKSLGG